MSSDRPAASAALLDMVPETPFYIPATSPTTRPRRTLKHDDTFAVLDSHGDIGATARRKRRHHAHRPGRKFLGARRRRIRSESQQQRCVNRSHCGLIPAAFSSRAHLAMSAKRIGFDG